MSDGASVVGELDAAAARAQGGDRAALEQLIRGLQDRLYRLALRFLTHPDQASDATQEMLILVITQLSQFRGESSVTTWAYSVATRHLLRHRRKLRKFRFEALESELGQPASAVEPRLLEGAEERVLEEEIFLGCTQAMLRALSDAERMAFVLGAVLELESPEAALVLGVSGATFRKRLSRARATLDAFVSKNCGVANPAARCRCQRQINHASRRGRLDPLHLRYAKPVAQTSLEALRAVGEIREVKRALALYQAQPTFRAPADFAAHVRELISAAPTLSAQSLRNLQR